MLLVLSSHIYSSTGLRAEHVAFSKVVFNPSPLIVSWEFMKSGASGSFTPEINYFLPRMTRFRGNV